MTSAISDAPTTKAAAAELTDLIVAPQSFFLPERWRCGLLLSEGRRLCTLYRRSSAHNSFLVIASILPNGS